MKSHVVSPEKLASALSERKTTQHTGNAVTDKTRTIAEQLRPL